ncbi:MAG: hypothetical protein A2150_00980 [Candidatus Muproteobacteria bacterium RBG_16_64_11]|uniref:Uncharacterized protein n=1 Tax=Candidatus Muproteobacteria bacterium RBG_16_64_11 TaxID=1817758 RepID=A0A1F6TBS6_9PROT|nr:MAG: hypothetical protein A2150_00980 [Candidatus Muproteobacteria bacterium RBG_16_64_11]
MARLMAPPRPAGLWETRNEKRREQQDEQPERDKHKDERCQAMRVGALRGGCRRVGDRNKKEKKRAPRLSGRFLK